MRTNHFLLIGSLFILAMACKPKVTVSDDQTLVNTLASMASDAFNSRDINKVLSIYANDAIVLNGPSKMSGLDSLRNGFTYMLQHSGNFKYYPALSSVKPDMVFIEGLFTFDWNVDGKITVGKGVMTVVYVKQPDGKWKITYCEENHGDILK